MSLLERKKIENRSTVGYVIGKGKVSSFLDKLLYHITTSANIYTSVEQKVPLQLHCDHATYIKGRVKTALFTVYETVKLNELSKKTSRYLWENTQLVVSPETVTLAQVLLYLGPFRRQADLVALIALSNSFSSNSNMLNKDCKA